MQDPLDYLCPQEMWAGHGNGRHSDGYSPLRSQNVKKTKNQLAREARKERFIGYSEWAEGKQYGHCYNCGNNRKIDSGQCYRCLKNKHLL